MFARVFVRQAVDHTVGFVESRRDDVEGLRIARVEPPKDRMSNVVGELHQPGRARVDEHRGVNQVSHDAPFGSDGTKLAAQPLKGGFLSASVQDQQTALTIVTLFDLPREEKIESLTEILKSQRDAVFAGSERCLFDGISEAACRVVAIPR